ncbi:MAG TPA: ABC transporter ATP-binding protein [Candidatus Dormibacteraeota bacterium]|nr:ABC transporter ATP-binding protein [Candidatus Dormibacteraeota bacterium]
MSYLTLNNVSHHYFTKKGYTKALSDVSFSVEEGEFISVIGPSGCGKSTILSLVAGILKNTAGEILFKQKPINQSGLEIGYMLQQDYLFPWKNIMENMLIGPKVKKANLNEAKETALALLDEVGLKNEADSYPDSLSGGMRQRVALARTLMTDPNVLLFDEPFSALDYQTKLRLENSVADLLKKHHKTAILVTHDIGEAISMSDRILLMGQNPGTIVKRFEVPIEIRNEIPFKVRRHHKYQSLFDNIWEELNKNEAVS